MAWWNPKTWKVFRKTKYLDGAVSRDKLYVKRILLDRVKAKTVTRDRNYRAMDFDKLKEFVDKYHKSDHDFIYHELSDEFPDCDEAALGAMADVIRGAIKNYIALLSKADIASGAIKEGLDFLPIFAEASYYSKRLDGWHRANIAIDSKGGVHCYEPQSRKWSNPDDEIDYSKGIWIDL